MESWDHERCLELIHLYELKPELWDPKHRFYHLKTKKQDALNEIASKLNITSEIVKSKLNSLTTSFRRERTKEIKSLGTGKGKYPSYIKQHIYHVILLRLV